MTTDNDVDSKAVGSAILVVDASESAVAHWPHIAQTAGAMRDIANRVYVLGCDTPVDAESVAVVDAAFPYQHARQCSLIAPIVESLLHQGRTVQSVVVVGNGRVWDLGDWVRRPPVGRWLLLRAGPDRLGTNEPDVLEYAAKDCQAALDRLAGQPLAPAPRSETHDSFWSSSHVRWTVDRAGFPMIYVGPLQAYVHLFPVTKAQFERYLWQHNPDEWGDARYAQLLARNPRASPDSLPEVAYERLFLTGILPEEIAPFARWLGPGVGLLTKAEWLDALGWLQAQPATPLLPGLVGQGLSPVAADTWRALYRTRSPRTMLELAYLVEGVVEWVHDREPSAGSRPYAGMGSPRPGFFPTIKKIDRPLYPVDPARRMAHFGFRLIRRS